jgi:hypothetical protein
MRVEGIIAIGVLPFFGGIHKAVERPPFDAAVPDVKR